MLTQRKKTACIFCHNDSRLAIGTEYKYRQAGNCPHCTRPHHLVCWDEYGGCALPGCLHFPSNDNFTPATLAGLHRIPTREEVAAVVELREALVLNNDEALLRVWRLHKPVLKDYPLPQDLRNRVRRAESDQQALAKLKKAIEQKDDNLSVQTWNNVRMQLEGYPGVAQYHERIRLAEKRLQVSRELDQTISKVRDKDTIAIWNKHRGLFGDHPLANRFRQQAENAEKRLGYLRELQTVIENGPDEKIVEVWQEHEEIFSNYPLARASVTQVQQAQQRLEAISQFMQAINADDDVQILKQLMRNERILADHPSVIAHQERISLARDRVGAMAELSDAIKSESDGLICTAWQKHKALLENYPPALPLQERIALAKDRAIALGQLRESLSQKNEEQTARIYLQNEALLKGSSDFSRRERSTVGKIVHKLARQKAADVTQFLFTEDDELIAGAYQRHRQILDATNTLTDNQRQRINLAIQRMAALGRLRKALRSNNNLDIFRTYTEDEKTLRYSRNFLPAERQQVTDARQAVLLSEYRMSITEGDLQKTIEMGQKALQGGCRLKLEDQNILNQAKRSITLLQRFTQAINSDDNRTIIRAYSSELDGSDFITPEQRKRLILAWDRYLRSLLLYPALKKEDDVAIARVYEQSLIGDPDYLTLEQIERCELAIKRVEAYRELQAALSKADDDLILEAYDHELLGSATLLTRSQNSRIQIALRQKKYVSNLENAVSSANPASVVAAFEATRDLGVYLPDDVDMVSVIRAGEVAAKLDELRELLSSGDGKRNQNIVEIGQRLLVMAPDLLSLDEKERISEAVHQHGARLRFQKAIQSGNEDRIARTRTDRTVVEPTVTS